MIVHFQESVNEKKYICLVISKTQEILSADKNMFVNSVVHVFKKE